MKRILEPEAMDDIEEATAYDALVSDKQGDMIDEFFALSVLNMGIASGKVLDIGTGTGRIPIKIVKKCFGLEVTGVDLSESMLDIANKNARAAGVQDRVSFQKADAKNLPFSQSSFDMIISHVALHHIADPVPVLAEANRVVKPGGALLIRDLKRPRNRLTLSLFARVFGAPYDAVQKKLYKDSLAAGFTAKEFESMAKDAGMENFRVASSFITHVGIVRKSSPFSPLPEIKEDKLHSIGLFWKVMKVFYVAK